MKLESYTKFNRMIAADYFKGIRKPGRGGVLHYHTYHEMSVVSHGRITYTTENSVSKVVDHCVIFSRANELHNPFVDSSHLYERYQLKFDTRLIGTTLADSSLLAGAMSHSYIKQLGQNDFAQLYALIKELHTKVREKPASELQLLEEKTGLVLLVLKSFEAKPLENKTEDSYISEVIAYIKNNFHKKLTLEEMANIFFISKSKLIYDFKNYCNMSIGEYITLTRIEAAKSCLMEGYSVKATAERCGFYSPSYFIKVFSGVTNITPLKFQFEYSKGLR